VRAWGGVVNDETSYLSERIIPFYVLTLGASVSMDRMGGRSSPKEAGPLAGVRNVTAVLRRRQTPSIHWPEHGSLVRPVTDGFAPSAN